MKGEMEEIKDAGKEGCRTEGMKNRRDAYRTGKMHERRDAGNERRRKGGTLERMDLDKEVFRRGWILRAWRDSGKENPIQQHGIYGVQS